MSSTGHTPPPPAPRRKPGTLLLAILPLALYLAHIALYVQYVNDDAYITFRYSRFLATGRGPYFNVGEHVEGYTNFLHMLVMSLVYAIGGVSAVPIVAKILGIVSGGAALALIQTLTRRLAGTSRRLASHASLAGSLAGGLVAVTPGYALNCASGLETGPLALWVTLAVYLGIRAEVDGRWRGAGIAWALAVLTRPEAVAVFGVWAVGYTLAALATAAPESDASRWTVALIRPIARDVAITAAVVTVHFVFRWLAYDGELLPNTWFAKSGGYLGYTPWEYVRRGALAPVLGLAGLLAGLVGWALAGLRPRFAWPAAAVAIFGAFMPLLVGADWMPGWRFSAPYLPMLASGVALGWILLMTPLTARDRALAPIAVVVAVGLAAVLHHPERVELAEMVVLRADGYATGHRALAEWIAETTGPDATVALMDIGIVGYYCDEARILDISGLTDRHIAKSPGPLLAKQYDPAYILDREPEIIVLVISAWGDSREPLPEGREIGTWIPIEGSIFAHPQFQAHYRRPPTDAAATDWTSEIAERIGAERVFEHAHPDQYYLLAAFRRLPVALNP